MEHLKKFIDELKLLINKYDISINNNEDEDCDDIEEMNEVDTLIDYTKLSNNNLSKNNNLKLYFFYNPNCPACKEVFPSWNKLMDLLNNYNNVIFDIHTVDVTFDNKTNTKLSNNYKIRAVPTFIGHNIITDNIIKREGTIGYKDLINFIKEFYLMNQ